MQLFWNKMHAGGRPDRASENAGDRPRLLNLGCGSTVHPLWDNYDSAPCDSSIGKIDLNRPLRFPDAFYRACYMSHVLEHLPRQRIGALLSEVSKVLEPEGVLRIVVPDLEGIVRAYLHELDAAASAEPGAIERHEWMTLELLDQLTRTFPGGFMLRKMRSRPLPQREFMERRVGLDGAKWIAGADDDRAGKTLGMASEDVYHAPEPNTRQRERFAQSGEAHRWMYDRVSLGALLKTAGFQNISVCRADESKINGFADYNLDTDGNGFVRKPDSLFMEARKPSPTI
jgi:hypothetical protein